MVDTSPLRASYSLSLSRTRRRHRRHGRIGLVLVLLVLLAVRGCSGQDDDDDDPFKAKTTTTTTTTSSKEECRVYFSPSTVPGAGWGVFAGRALAVGDDVMDGDIVIPLTDFAWHAGRTTTHYHRHATISYTVWDDYIWGADE